MKKGMILVAKDPCVMDVSQKETLTVGNAYTVKFVNRKGNELGVIDDDGYVHWFDFDVLSEFFDIPETDPFQEFFSFMHKTHGLILPNGEMWDILNEIEKLQEKLKA
jgi:hypothetical protein